MGFIEELFHQVALLLKIMKLPYWRLCGSKKAKGRWPPVNIKFLNTLYYFIIHFRFSIRDLLPVTVTLFFAVFFDDYVV